MTFYFKSPHVNILHIFNGLYEFAINRDKAFEISTDIAIFVQLTKTTVQKYILRYVNRKNSEIY